MPAIRISATRIATPAAAPAAATGSIGARPASLRRASPFAALGLALVMTLATLSTIDQLAQPAGAEWLWAQPASTVARA